MSGTDVWRTDVWRMGRPLLCCLSDMFGSLSCWKTDPWPNSRILAKGRRFYSTWHINWPLNAVKSFCTLSRKNHNDSTSMLDCADDVLWVILSISLPPNILILRSTLVFCPNQLRVGADGQFLVIDFSWSSSPYEARSCNVAPDWGWLIVILYFFPFLNNHTNRCHLLTKVYSAGLQSCPWLPLTALWSWTWWWRD